MLEIILQAISDHKTQDLAMLSQKTGLSVSVLAEGMRQLMRLGYLKEELPASCSAGCAGCVKSCGTRMPKMIALTEKGRQKIQML